MNREAEFLIAAVRRFLHPEMALPDHAGIDWEKLLRLAADHAVTAMVYGALKNASPPGPIRERLKAEFARTIRSSFVQSGELTRLARLLQEKGIPAISLKGPLLSQYLYGNLETRSSEDIDLLVKPGDVLRVRDALNSRGYQVASVLHWNSDSACLRSRENEIAFADPTGWLSIDVHWRILPPYFANPFDRIDVWRSLQTVTIGGQPTYVLAPEQNFLLLCCHGAKHAFERLGWICDVARFMMVTPKLDWTMIAKQADDSRTSRQVMLGVRLAVDVLGAPEPPGFSGGAEVARAAQFVRDRLITGAALPVPHFELARYSLMLFDSISHRVRFLAGQLMPSPAEHSALRLPPALYFLYYPFRPIRLIAKQVQRLRRNT